MTHVIRIGLILVPALTLACATAAPPPELVEARLAYSDAEAASARTAPTELRDARLALDAAEVEYKEEPRSVEVRDRAYLAMRRAQLASTRAEIVASHAQRDASVVKLRSLGVETAKDLRETRRDLATTDGKMRTARAQAGQLKQELRDNESAAQQLAATLATEQEARHRAELELMATLQAMQAAQSVREEPRGLVITLSGGVLFESGRATLRGPARAALDEVATALLKVPDRSIVIAGHTDSRGSAASNQTLSERRGDAVRAHLVGRGVPAASITSVGHGADQPVADNDSAEGRANNRRVEIVLAPVTEPR